MKKIISRPVVAGCLILFIMTFCLMSLSVPAYSADKAIAKLTSFSGTVLIKSKGEWGVQPEEGMSLYSDDKIVTRMGIAAVTFDDGAVIEIKANSNLLIRDTEETAGLGKEIREVKRQLRLLVGKVLFRSGKGSSTKTTLETTTMVCGLRGTAGTLSIDAAGVTYLMFTEGGGDTIGNFISGIATDVPAEIADLNAAQRAAFVAAVAAELVKMATERLASGEITDAEAALAVANAAKAAALEAKAAAEAMLNNPDEDIRNEARAAIKAAEAAIKAAEGAQQAAIAAGATGDVLKAIAGLADMFGFDVQIENFMNGGDDDRVLGDSYGVLGDYLTRMVYNPAPQGNEDEILPEDDGEAPVVEMTDSPDAFDSSSSPVFSFIADESVTYFYVLDGGERVRVGTSSAGEVSFELDSLSEGAHTLELIVQDAYGNAAVRTFEWITDTTAPVIAITAEPGTVTTLTASTTNDEPGTVSYTFIDAETGDYINPEDVSAGTYGIVVTATDQAGNVSYTTFALYNAALAGQSYGMGNVIVGSAEGSVAAIYEAGQETGSGGWGIDMEGEWSEGNTNGFSLASGGTSGDNEGYWLSVADGSIGTSGSATGTTSFYLINEASVSKGTGTFTGTFAGDYTWAGSDTGSGLVTTPFVMAGKTYADVSSYYYKQTSINSITDGTALGYAGLTATDTSDYDYFAMGKYTDYLTSYKYNSPYLWFTEVCDDDSPYAFIGGVWGNDAIDGFLAGLYDTDEAAGILYTDVLGNYYLLDATNYDGMWKVEGTLTPVEITEIPEGYSISDDPSEDYFNFNDIIYSPNGLSLDSTFSSGNGASLTDYIVTDEGEFYKALGVWELRLAGDCDSSSGYYTQENDWSLSLAGYETEEGPLSVLLEIGTGAKESLWNTDTGEISACVAGSWVDADEAITGIIGGRLVGTFDATNSMWQALAMGSLLDTKTFLDMVDNNPSALAALDIPCVEIGNTTMTGGYTPATGGGEAWNVTMEDVTFFAYSTGADPKIWATGDVSGNFTATPSVNESAALSSTSGSTFSATFTIDSWESNDWSATVDGYGTITRTDTTGTYYADIEGGAAGSYTGTTSGTFTGTASGVTRELLP